jgi:hypothetical protein
VPIAEKIVDIWGHFQHGIQMGGVLIITTKLKNVMSTHFDVISGDCTDLDSFSIFSSRNCS